MSSDGFEFTKAAYSDYHRCFRIQGHYEVVRQFQHVACGFDPDSDNTLAFRTQNWSIPPKCQTGRKAKPSLMLDLMVLISYIVNPVPQRTQLQGG